MNTTPEYVNAVKPPLFAGVTGGPASVLTVQRLNQIMTEWQLAVNFAHAKEENDTHTFINLDQINDPAFSGAVLVATQFRHGRFDLRTQAVK